MDTAFAQPHCPATYSTSSTTPTTVPLDPTLPQVRNDALVYLAIAVAGFAAVPTLFWLRDKRHKDRERRKNRAMLESLKAKMDATRAMAIKTVESPARSVAPTSPEPRSVDEAPELDEFKEKKKRSKDRRKRGRDREPSRAVRSKPFLPSSGPFSVPESARDQPATDYTPRAPAQSCLLDIPDKCRSPSMPAIASPTPLSLISPSFRAPSPVSPNRRSETSSSHPGQSRSTSVSPTTAPLTPPPLSSSVSLPPLVAVKSQESDSWLPQLSDIPRDDPAWDWDGQSSTYSTGSPSRAPSSSDCHPVQPVQKQPRAANKTVATRPAVSSPASPTTSAMPSVPSLVFPSLNAHPPPGASLATQIASLKGALEASRTREDKHRREAERWSKDCDLIKWRWNEAADMWRRREAELQTQIHHLVIQLQTFTHAMQPTSLSPPISFMPAPGQTPFPLPMQFSSLPGSPFSIHPASGSPDVVNEDLAEAILKRPGSIRPSTVSGSHNVTRHGDEEHAILTEDSSSQQQAKHAKTDKGDEVIEFEFPTLIERPANSPRISRDREVVVSADEVEVFH